MPSRPTLHFVALHVVFFLFSLMGSVEGKGGGKGSSKKSTKIKSSKSSTVKLSPRNSAIVGGVIGGFACLLVLFVLWKKFQEKRKQKDTIAAGEDEEAQHSEVSTPQLGEKIDPGFYVPSPPIEPPPTYGSGNDNTNDHPAFPMPMPMPTPTVPQPPMPTDQPMKPN